MPEISNAFVVLLGMGTVFFGLICIVFLCYLMSAVVGMIAKPSNEPKQTTAPAPVATSVATAPIADRQAIIAASCAVIAEELGEDVKNIKVVSFKKV